MVSSITFEGPNSGLQIGHNSGNVTAHFFPTEASSNQTCLQDLRTTDPRDDKERIVSASGGLLKESYLWIFDNDDYKEWQNSETKRILWIKGDPGKGKSMLLCGIIEELTQSTRDHASISFFFCQATDLRINSATAVLRGLIYLLVEQQPSLIVHIREKYDQAGKSLFQDINAWSAVSSIFTNILRDPTLKSTYIIVDALDECTTGLVSLLEFMIQELTSSPRVKWLVSSRNWPQIAECIQSITQSLSLSLELNEEYVSEAVNKFIHYKVKHLGRIKRYTAEIFNAVFRHLSSNSQGTFLWVALACHCLAKTSRWRTLVTLKNFPAGLKALYARMIDIVYESEDVELSKQILAVMSTVYRPLAIDEMARLVELPTYLRDDSEILKDVIATCGSFLTLRDNMVVFVHQSAKEFLLEDATNEIFPSGKETEHERIFLRSFQVMFKILRRNISKIQVPVTGVKQCSPSSLEAIQYACIYWAKHLQASGIDGPVLFNLCEGGQVDLFLKDKLLQWLEALACMECMPQGITALLILESLLHKSNASQIIQDRVKDVLQFVRYYRIAIECSPLQAYRSPLIFSPRKSFAMVSYARERPKWILNEPTVDEAWGPCLQTLEGHRGPVFSIAWSRDESLLASGSLDKTVKIWDAATGQCKFTLEGHIESVHSVIWSPEGGLLASRSLHGTVKIWNSKTGQLISTLEGINDLCSSFVWSKDESLVAAIFSGEEIRVWEASNGQCIFTQRGCFCSVVWSQDGKYLLSVSSDITIKSWDLTTGQCESTIEGQSHSNRSIAWSKSIFRFASTASDHKIRVWDLETGQCQSTLEGHTNTVRLLKWSDNENQLASASFDETVRIWDLTTEQCLSKVKTHFFSDFSILYSRDEARLAMAAGSYRIKIWNVSKSRYERILEGHQDIVLRVAWSHNKGQLASASYDGTVKIWELATSHTARNPDGHAGRVTRMVWKQDGSRLATASSDGAIKIWNPATGRCVLTLVAHESFVQSLIWSRDGSRLASASFDQTIKVWDLTTGCCNKVFRGHSGAVFSLYWSQNESRLVSGSSDNTVRIWEVATGECILVLSGHRDRIRFVDLSRDETRIASASNDKTIMIWNAGNGQWLSTLKGHDAPVTSLMWSRNAKRLATASVDGTVKLWNSKTAECLFTLRGHGNWVTSIAWSQDECRLASASLDRSVKIWNPVTGNCELTLQINSPWILGFDSVDFNHLHTSFGTFAIDSSLRAPYGYGLNDDYSWITFSGENLLWIPPEYRSSELSPGNPSFSKPVRTVAIGCISGRVVFIALAQERQLSMIL